MRRQSGSARRYADAVFELALQRDALDTWGQELRRISSVVADPTALRALTSPTISLQQRRLALESAAGPLSREIVGLLRILFERKRIDLIPGVADAFAQRVRTYRGIELADVTTAVELADTEKQLITARLARRTGRTVELETHVDPAILGGVVARVGDQLFDGSVRGKLEALRKRLEGTRRA